MSSIIDNRDGNTLQARIERITGGSRSLDIATAFFSLDALAMVACNLRDCENVRILFGDMANATERAKLMSRLRTQSDADLAERRATDPTLSNLAIADALFKQGRVQARCYTAKKFHAKAYLAGREHYPNRMGILGSGNFTGAGLTRNIELNVELTPEQTEALNDWFEARWAEAVEDDVTAQIRKEIRRQIELYDPRTLYHRALLLWGDWVQGREPLPELGVLETLDPHQVDAYRQALRIIAREQGVLISDGVGLGKSFVALALMEHFLARGKRAFLIAPKAILASSWEGYLANYLARYSRGYKSLVNQPMTWFGFDEKDIKCAEKRAELIGFSEQAEIIVIDESHNFRKTDSNRYANLLSMLQDGPLGAKTVILLTATPINTEYRDLAAQFRLITQETGRIAGVRIEQFQKAAVELDKERRAGPRAQMEFDLEPDTELKPMGLLKQGLQSVAIQRSRRTCREIAAAQGRTLRFPEREPIRTVQYELSPEYAEVVRYTKQEFEELARFLRTYRAEVSRASQAEGAQRRLKIKLPERGLRFSAYLPDRYSRKPGESLREAQVESFLVSLVFVNVMKQLESSPVAFQGIVQALGAGLCARLRHIADRGELPLDQIRDVIERHAGWVDRDLSMVDSDEDEDDDGVAADAEGDEMDEWLVRALKVKGVQKGLEKFNSETHDVQTWRRHIETDLSILQEIHVRIVAARAMGPDRKLDEIRERVREQLDMGRKVLIFTQSRRTAAYLEQELRRELGDRVARIDAGVEGARRAKILNAFSPLYNPLDVKQKPLARIDALVSTDVLAEGVNLQEAGCILNYDIHWNPVRLIQRIGRVDRRLRDGDPVHRFAVLNVHPPPEIEQIIDLVGTVENRKRKITSMLGLDQSFFSASDPEGTLLEFNARFEGEVSARDEALKAYDELITQRPNEVAAADDLPPGAFGVWNGAPANGLFAAFVMRADDEKVSDVDRERFRAVIDMPVLVMEMDGKLTTEPTEILALLARTVRGERSGDPGDAEQLKAGLNDFARPRDRAFTTAA